MCAKQADGIIIYKGDVKLQPCTKMDDWCFSIQTGVIMKKILVAVDSFKGSMTSLEAGNAIKKGITDALLDRLSLDDSRIESMAQGYVLWLMAERALLMLLYMEEMVSAESDVM